MNHNFLKFFLVIALSLLTLALLPFLPLFSDFPWLGCFLSRTLAFVFVPSLFIDRRAFFFASRRATLSGSVDFIFFRISLDRPAILSPSCGSPYTWADATWEARSDFPLGACISRWGRLEVSLFPSLAFGTILHFWTRSLRFANLNFPCSNARTSSTQSRSYKNGRDVGQAAIKPKRTYGKLYVCKPFPKLCVAITDNANLRNPSFRFLRHSFADITRTTFGTDKGLKKGAQILLCAGKVHVANKDGQACINGMDRANRVLWQSVWSVNKVNAKGVIEEWGTIALFNGDLGSLERV